MPQDHCVGIEEWISEAKRVRQRAYAPYSEFPVGVVLVSNEGQVFSGCNVENLSFGLTICAERVALGAAIAAGVRTFTTLVVVADTEKPVSPCGACRQVMAEFSPELEIWLCTLSGLRERFTLDQLLPRASTGILDRP